jgi:glycosyltransferase involved in cell wall biosynthesis
VAGVPRPRLLVAKGSFESMGGAERDLLRNLPAIAESFDVSVATLASASELGSACEGLGLELMCPEERWSPPQGVLSSVLDSGMGSASKAWLSIGGLVESLNGFDCVHLTSGDGSLALLEHIPEMVPVHLHLLEPHRGLHEDVLHRGLDGTPKRSLGLTRAILSRSRRRDISAIRDLSLRSNSSISGNSSYTAGRISEVYGVRSGVLLPSVVSDEFPENAGEREPESVGELEGEYVVSVGRASWVKGAWETISMLSGSGVALAHVGGGDEDDLRKLEGHAKSMGVGLWCAPRLSSPELASLYRGALAVVSMAHGEPFGLTPIEAQSVGTPALFVDEGGFRETIVDGVSGRLLPRGDFDEWHRALSEARDPENRSSWSENGRVAISEAGLDPRGHCDRLIAILRI